MKNSQRRAMFAKINRDRVNDIEKDEIVLTTTNDGEFYRRVISPNVRNFEKRMKRNDFQKGFALQKKSFIDHLGNEAVKRYETEFTDGKKMGIDVDTKRAIGEEIAEKIIDEARDNIRNEVNPKRKFLVSKKFGDREEWLSRNKNIEDAMRSF